MKKSELKTGMSCVTRNGNCFRVFILDREVVLADGHSWLTSSIREDLMNGCGHHHYDILKVFGHLRYSELLNPKAHGKLLWEREEAPELPKYYRLMKEGEVLGKLDKYLYEGRWEHPHTDQHVGDVLDDSFNPHCTPDIDVPEGYELWHVAGEEAPEEELPLYAKCSTTTIGGIGWVPTSENQDYTRCHYAIPIAKPQEETMVTVNGKEFSESTVAAALREYVG